MRIENGFTITSRTSIFIHSNCKNYIDLDQYKSQNAKIKNDEIMNKLITSKFIVKNDIMHTKRDNIKVFEILMSLDQ